MGDEITVVLNLPKSVQGKIRVLLPENLRNLHNTWEIAVASFYYKNCEIKPFDHLLIYLEELDPSSISEGDFVHKHLFFTAPVHKVCFHEPQNLIYNKLHCKQLKEFNLTVRSERGRPLKIIENTCFIKVKIRPMKDENHMTLRLHKSNSDLADFKIDFKDHLHLQQVGSWQIAMQYAHFPNPKHEIKDDASLWFSINLAATTSEASYSEVAFAIDDRTANKFEHIGDLIMEMNKRIYKADVSDKDSALLVLPPPRFLTKEDFQIIKLGKHVVLFCKKDLGTFHFRTSKMLGFMLGKTDGGYKKAALDINLQAYGGAYQFTNEHDIKRRLPMPHFHVMCDIITPVIVNDEYKQILSIIPSQDEELPHYFYEPKHMDYAYIQNSIINSIGIKIVDHEGKKVDFGIGDKHRQSITIAFRIRQIL